MRSLHQSFLYKNHQSIKKTFKQKYIEPKSVETSIQKTPINLANSKINSAEISANYTSSFDNLRVNSRSQTASNPYTNNIMAKQIGRKSFNNNANKLV